MPDRYRVEKFLPLSPPVAGILLGLAEEPAHGYALLGRVRRQSGGAIDLATGQLYRHLRRLLDEEWAEEIAPPPEQTSDDARRRYYRLTARGRQVLAAELQRLQAQVDLSRRLGLLEEA